MYKLFVTILVQTPFSISSLIRSDTSETIDSPLFLLKINCNNILSLRTVTQYLPYYSLLIIPQIFFTMNSNRLLILFTVTYIFKVFRAFYFFLRFVFYMSDCFLSGPGVYRHLEDSIRCSGTRVKDCCLSVGRCWEPNSGTLNNESFTQHWAF